MPSRGIWPGSRLIGEVLATLLLTKGPANQRTPPRHAELPVSGAPDWGVRGENGWGAGATRTVASGPQTNGHTNSETAPRAKHAESGAGVRVSGACSNR